jgi:hypothetical protein
MRTVAILLFIGLGALAAAEAEVSDLGESLGYLRLRDLDGEAFAVPEGPLVIDLRQAQLAGTAGTERLRELLAAPGIRLVLVSEATAPAVISLLDTRGPMVLTLGGTEAPPTDIRVTVSALEDRRAYDALDQGGNLADLANPLLVKTRRDEASIVRARRTGTRPAEAAPPGEGANPAAPPAPPNAPAPTVPAAATPAATDSPTPALVDLVLQRAVKLHRGLQALKRI